MSDKYRQCEICGEHDFFGDSILGSHKCKPLWRVWEPDREETEYDGAMQIHARDAQEACEKWASRDDWESAEGAIAMERHEPEICVREAGGDEIHRFKVRGEMVPSYRAEPLKGKARGEKEEDEPEEDEDEAQTG